MIAKENRDQNYLKKCFQLAKNGAGKVSPNPLVGAVLVKNGKVIGKGYHEKYGKDHAEVEAIRKAKESVAGSTLYCNLEPCCHTKKQTPPCVPLIIKNNIKRVVVSNPDPNPAVNGKGFGLLRKAGIKVDTGILQNEGAELNKFYFKYIKEKIPYVTIKIAQSFDGKISESRKKQTWLTGKQSRLFVHRLRSEYDAVLVGANTIKADNPQLTVREVKGRNPVRIILDGKLSIPLKSKVIEFPDPHNTWVFTSKNVSRKKVEVLSGKGIKVVQMAAAEGTNINLKKLLRILPKYKITSLLVEGGADIFSQFIEEGLFDEIIILQSPKILGKGISISNIKKIKNFKVLSTTRLGKDIKLVYEKNFSN